jgi:hypothetical protein
MNRQERINRLVARKLQPAGNGKALCYAGRVLCGYLGHAAAARPQAPVANAKS